MGINKITFDESSGEIFINPIPQSGDEHTIFYEPSVPVSPTPTPSVSPPAPSATPTPTPTPSTSVAGPSGPEMIMTWDTTNGGVNNQINLPLRGPVSYNAETIPASDYDFWVDWGEGGGYDTHITSYTDSNKQHTYVSSGIKTVKVQGQFGSFYFNNSGDRLKLTDISQFDGMEFDCGLSAFYGCSNLDFSATDAPNLTLSKGIASPLDEMFKNSSISSNINTWNVSGATSMNEMFSNADSFNLDVGGWDVSNVTDMHNLFYGTATFNNGNSGAISGWTTSNVTDMSGMFYSAAAFNQDIGNWDVSNVTTMQYLFLFANSFNNGGSPSISGWTTSEVTNMTNTFSICPFNQPIGDWDVSNVTTMQQMFANNSSFNQPIGEWDVSKVESFDTMFNQADDFDQDIGAWNVSGATNMKNMFGSTEKFNNGGSPSISGWTTSSVINMEGMFGSTEAFNQPIGAWDVSNVTNMKFMFANNEVFAQNINDWDVSNVETMYWMFHRNSGGPFAFEGEIYDWEPLALLSGNTAGLTEFYANISSQAIATVHYDQLLINWDALGSSLPDNIYAGFGTSKYTGGGAAATARAALVTKGWTITDGGTV